MKNNEAAQTEKVYLTADKFKELANELAKTKTDVQLMRATAEMFPSMDRIGKGEIVYHYYKAHQFMSLLFNKFQDIEEDLEEIASVLYAVTEPNELNELVDAKDIENN